MMNEQMQKYLAALRESALKQQAAEEAGTTGFTMQ